MQDARIDMEQTRATPVLRYLEEAARNVRYALRQLRRAPGFAVTAVATLALGIGATTAIFTLIHVVLLKPLPVARPAELYAVGDAKRPGVYTGLPDNWELFSYDLYKYLREHTEGFESLAAFQSSPRRIGVRRSGDARAAEPFSAQFVSGNYLATFGVRVAAGRPIGEEDDHAGAAPVAMIAYRVWRDRYALDPAVIGATFQMNGAAVTVVGATPPGFFGDTLRPEVPDFWLPLSSEPAVNRGVWITNPQLHWLYLMGRVKPGASVRTVEAQMQTELRQWLTHWKGKLGPDEVERLPRQTLHLRPGETGMGVMRGRYAAGLELLMAISGFVLLIVCANLANLLLARGLGRRRETSLLLALGAGRSRVVRQALTESVVVGLIGGALGIGIASAGTQALLKAVFAGTNSLPMSATPDGAVLGFALATSLLASLIFGAVPAWSANAADPIEALRGSGRSTGQTGTTIQRGLVVTQAAMSVVLLAATGLLTQSLRNLEHQKFGFASERRVVVRIDPNLAGYKTDQLDALYRTIRDRLARLPGAASVSYSLWAPMSGGFWTTDVSIDGQPPPTVDGQNLTAWNRVGPDYFDTIGTPILRGRPILESDTAATRHVAVISDAFARRYFPNVDPIGQHFGVWAESQPELAKSVEVVGIAADAKYDKPEQRASPMYFVPRSQMTDYKDPGTMAFETRSLFAQDVVVRFESGVGPVEGAIRQTFADIDPNLPIIRIQNLDAATASQFSREVLIVKLTTLFGVTALLLASIGLYGVTSYAVAQRRKEIGIRVALGADRTSVVKMVLSSSFAMVGAGLAIGVLLALGMGRLVGTQLYGTSWHSPSILSEATLALALCALVATVVPARRAATLDPVETLRGE